MIGNDKVVEAEVVSTSVPDVVPDFAITLAQAKSRLEQFKQFVKSQMVKGIDYGNIPYVEKPSLFKPGAEKLCNIFGFAPQFKVMDQVKDWEKGFFHYQIKCTLVSRRDGMVVAEGVGSCNSKEKRYRNQDAFTLDNTILKMAKKRAHIDATLTATRASGEFTQDIEDLDIVKPKSTSAKKSELGGKINKPSSGKTPVSEKTKTNASGLAPLQLPEKHDITEGLVQRLSEAWEMADGDQREQVLYNLEIQNTQEIKTNARASQVYNMLADLVKGK